MDYQTIEAIAKHAARARIQNVESESEAFIRIATGVELGLTPLQALRGVNLIKNRITLSADLIAAVIRKSPLCESWECVESTDKRATFATTRNGKTQTITFTMEDAKRAQLDKPNRDGTPSNWGKYPAQMLRARAITGLARLVYPDVTLGLYDPDEIETSVPAPDVANVPTLPVVETALQLPAPGVKKPSTLAGLKLIATSLSVDETITQFAELWITQPIEKREAGIAWGEKNLPQVTNEHWAALRAITNPHSDFKFEPLFTAWYLANIPSEAAEHYRTKNDI